MVIQANSTRCRAAPFAFFKIRRALDDETGLQLIGLLVAWLVNPSVPHAAVGFAEIWLVASQKRFRPVRFRPQALRREGIQARPFMKFVVPVRRAPEPQSSVVFDEKHEQSMLNHTA